MQQAERAPPVGVAGVKTRTTITPTPLVGAHRIVYAGVSGGIVGVRLHVHQHVCRSG